MNGKLVSISLVVPCFNEETVIGQTVEKLSSLCKDLIDRNKISTSSFILFIDDGSRDKTWETIENASSSNKIIRGIKLSHNSGHQNALIAGLMFAKDKSDAVISIDADLQDDIAIIEKFIDKYNEGFEIVYGVRAKRNKDSFFKRFSAELFYKLMLWMGVEIIYNHADYRLTSKKVLDNLACFDERNMFIRGIFPLIGYQSASVTYDRKERLAGESKYTLKKMLAFAWDGITSFSVRPLKLITNIGALVFILSILCGVWVIIELVNGNTVHGWASIVLPIYFIGGIQLLSLGIIGEYIGKIYKETKHRPRYFIEKITK